MGPHRDPVTGKVTVIAVTGPSASGKTTLAQALASHLPGAVHLQQDAYFRDPDDYPPDANFCDHRWLHLDAFLDAFRALAAGGRTSVPDMGFATFRPRGHHYLGPARYLIVDGMTVLRPPEIRHRCQHAADLALRDDPAIQVIKDSPSDVTRAGPSRARPVRSGTPGRIRKPQAPHGRGLGASSADDAAEARHSASATPWLPFVRMLRLGSHGVALAG